VGGLIGGNLPHKLLAVGIVLKRLKSNCQKKKRTSADRGGGGRRPFFEYKKNRTARKKALSSTPEIMPGKIV